MTDKNLGRRETAEIVRDVGGRIVGRTRLQKVAYLLELAGFGVGFHFEYRHFGPYCEELAEGMRAAQAFGLIEEEERPTEWGGFYSIYRALPEVGEQIQNDRAVFASLAAQIGAITLELLATAAYLRYEEGYDDPWEKTARLKPEKSEGRLDQAKDAYRKLLQLETPTRLPEIV